MHRPRSRPGTERLTLRPLIRHRRQARERHVDPALTHPVLDRGAYRLVDDAALVPPLDRPIPLDQVEERIDRLVRMRLPAPPIDEPQIAALVHPDDAVLRVVPLYLGRYRVVARPVHRQPRGTLIRRVPAEHRPLEVTTRLVGRALLIERAPRPLRERVALDRLPELDRHILRPQVL